MRFRSEWFGHLAQLAPVLQGLNLDEDPRLDDMAGKLGQFLINHTEDKLKQSHHRRDRARQDMDKIHSDLTAIFGPMKQEKDKEEA